MPEINNVPDNDTKPEPYPEQYPIEPRYHPVNKLARKVYDALASSKLAMVLLVAILVCCVFGVTIFREQRSGEVIFGALWFNGLLTMLVINVACCFFGRIWGRKVTIISFGMILFHLSFVAMFTGIIYNGLFYFRGEMMITEGETLSNSQRQSYIGVERGRFFSLSRLKGETTLNRLRVGYKVGGSNKRVAYDISVGEGNRIKHEIIYLTNNLDYEGLLFIPDREGYSLLTVLYDKQGTELYGAHIPLQSLMRRDKTRSFTTGTKEGPGSIVFPQSPEKPLVNVSMTYHPNPSKERAGEVYFRVWPLTANPVAHDAKPLSEGSAAIGKIFTGSDYSLSIKEVRYWVVMKVNYEPGKPFVLGSLWVGLAGMLITTIGRIRRGRRGAENS